MRKSVLVTSLIILGSTVGAAAGWIALRPQDKFGRGMALAAQGDTRGAIIWMHGAVQDDPARAEAHFQLGLLDLMTGDAIAAERELIAARERGWAARDVAVPLAEAVLGQRRYADVLSGFPMEIASSDMAPRLLITRAQAELGLKHLAAARAAIDEAQSRNPQSGPAALVASRVAQAQGDLVLARAKAGQAVALTPRSTEAQSQQAELRLSQGDRAGALESYEAAIASAATSRDQLLSLRLRRAALLVDMGDERAGEAIDALLREQPNQFYALYLRALQFAQRKDWVAADLALSRVGAAIETIPRGEYLAAVIKSNVGQASQALDAAEHAVSRAQSDQMAVRLLASLYLTKQRTDQALAVLTRSVAAGHPETATFSLLAQAYIAAGQPEKARATLLAATVLAPSDRQLAGQLAAMQLRIGDARGATLTLEHSIDALPVALPPGTGAVADPGPSASQTIAALVLTALQAGDVDRATAAVERLRQLGGDQAQLSLLEGLTRMASVDLPGARAAFETALSVNPTLLPARFALARLYVQQGDQDHAASLLQQIVDTDPTNVQALSGLADLDLAAGQTDRALSRLENAHGAAPANIPIIVALSQFYVRTGSPAKALALLDAAQAGKGDPNKVSTDAGLVPLLATRARALSALGRAVEAIETLRTMLVQLPGNIVLRVQVADMLAAEKDWTAAHKVVADGLVLQPGNAALLGRDVRLAAKAGGLSAGLARADQLAAEPANAGAALMLKGDLLLAEQHYDDAAAAYRSQIGPSAPVELVIRLSEALTGAGQAAKAAANLRDWLVGHPASPEALIALSSLDIAMGQLADARGHLERGLAIQPANAVALNNYAWLLQQAGDLPLAQQMANRAWLLAPTPQSADTLGWIALARGEKEMALVLLSQAATSLKDDLTVQYHYANSLRQNGRSKEARSILVTLVGQPAGFPEKLAANEMLKTMAP